MSDFLTVLLFSWIPFAGALAYSLTAAPLGAMLSLRGEILLGVALPPVGSAAIVLAILLGVPGEQTLVLYLCAVAGILVVTMLLPHEGRGPGGSPRWRAGLLAAIFCAGQAVTILVTAVSTDVEAHVQHMLRGELLAIGPDGLAAFLVLTVLVLAAGVRFRGLFFALALDEEGLRVRFGRRARALLFAFRALSAVLIAAGVIWVGPLLTLALLTVPTMLQERRPTGFVPHFLWVIASGALAVCAGFSGSIALDLPPVPVVVSALFVVSGAIVALRRG
jgi:ABC-type Mn2+/Zn2+ transport system permease subunit